MLVSTEGCTRTVRSLLGRIQTLNRKSRGIFAVTRVRAMTSETWIVNVTFQLVVLPSYLELKELLDKPAALLLAANCLKLMYEARGPSSSSFHS